MKLEPRNLETDGDRIVTINLDLRYSIADPFNQSARQKERVAMRKDRREGIKNNLDDRYEEGRRKGRRKGHVSTRLLRRPITAQDMH
jgi:flagellar biosynthesis/type III secretory pathway protein FliH